MGHRVAKLALAAGLMFGVWKGAQALPIPPVTEVFNDASARITEPAGRTAPAQTPAREYRLPSLKVPDPANPATGEVWRIRQGSWEMAKSGHHTFLEFAPYCEKSSSCPSKGEIYQIHGLAMDDLRKTHARVVHGDAVDLVDFA